ncbi:MAG: UDP-N-acetylglucosamine--LPS N-acetylglucosamine transferase [Planctomycetota bacterium]
MIPSAPGDRPRRILAIASGGGHWVQLLRLRSAFAGHAVTYATVARAYAADVPGCRFRAIPDATQWNKLRLLWLAFRVLLLVLRERPDVIVSTGAAPGYFALRLGKLLRARTVWLDSIANVETLSLAGRLAGRYADLWLTQWPHLARPAGPHFLGGTV